MICAGVGSTLPFTAIPTSNQLTDLTSSPCAAMSISADPSPATSVLNSPEMSVLENSGDDSTGDAVAAPFRSCERSPVMWQGVDEVLRGSNNFAPAPHAPNPAAMITDDLDVQIKPALYDPLKRYVFTDSLFPSLFGTVVVAWDRLQERTVAIKLSNIDLVKMRRSSKGIPVHENPLLEAEVMRQISTHPSIVLLNDEHVAGNVHWMVMEYVPCGDLFDHMRTQGRMEPVSYTHLTLPTNREV